MRREPHLADIIQDIRFSGRSLLRTPVLALVIVATVGLGIGATTTLFAGVEAAFLRPLPYTEPERLVWIYTDAPPFQFRFSAADYLALEAQQSQFERIAGFTNRSMTFSDGTAAHLLQGRAVSWTYFGTLGIRPGLGRDFSQADGTPGQPPAVIVSHGFWQQHLGGRTDILGGPLTLDGADYTLVGVLPRRVGPLEARQDFFVAAQIRPPNRRGPFSYWMIGRLRDGASHSSAASELHAINRRIFPIWKLSYQDDQATWSLLDLKSRLVRDKGTAGALALATVALVWLIACVNASNLLLARVTSRGSELALRAALGASGPRVFRLLLVESLLLATAAGMMGAAIAWIGMTMLKNTGTTYLPRTQELGMTPPVAGVFAAATLLSVAIFGLIPALQRRPRELDASLRSAGRSSASRTSRQVRQWLVASQFAISTPLLVVAGLLLVSLDTLERAELGFDPGRLMTGSIRLPSGLYQDRGRVENFWHQLSLRLAAIPGASAVAFSDSLPPQGANNINNFDLEESPTPAGASQPSTPWVSVTPGYFAALAITRLDGRLLTEDDARRESLDSVVVDRAWAHRFFPGRSAVGKRFREGGCTACPWTTVVGVVSDVRYAGLEAPSPGTVYAPLAGGTIRSIVVRTNGDPRLLAGPVRQAVRELDGAVPLTDVATGTELVARSLEAPASLSTLVAAVGAMALLLATLGIYGVLAYFVQQHRQEIAIRLALGGSPAHVLRLVLRQAVVFAGSGLAAGLPLAYLASGAISGLLHGVAPHGLSIYVMVSGVLMSFALAACVLPATRAVSVQPGTLLRQDC